MTLYLNGSPKQKQGNSEYFINRVKDEGDVFYLYKDKFDKIDFSLYDTIVFSFPLYVDAPSNKVIEFMEYISCNNIDIENKYIYAISNCGFLEAKQNDTALEIIRLFAKNNKAKFMGGFKIGAGEIVGKCDKIKIYKVVNIDFLHKIKKFKKYIINKQYIELDTTIKPMTKRLYVYLANKSWRKKCKKNHCYDA